MHTAIRSLTITDIQGVHKKAEFCLQVHILTRILSNETSVCSRLKLYSFSFFWIGCL